MGKYLYSGNFGQYILRPVLRVIRCTKRFQSTRYNQGLFNLIIQSAINHLKTMNCESDFLTGLGIASSLNGLSCMIAAPCLGKVTDYYDTLEPGFALGAISLLVSSTLTILYSFTASR